jgi:hypothetical protein
MARNRAACARRTSRVPVVYPISRGFGAASGLMLNALLALT